MPSDTHNSVWASTPATGHQEELTTPSGQTCRAKKMSIEAMISEGLLVESDAITAQITKHLTAPKAKRKAAGPTPPKKESPTVDVSSLMKDKKAVTEMIGMIDRIMPHIVVSPVVKLHYTEQTVGKTTVTKLIPEEAPDGEVSRESIRAKNPDQAIVFTDQINLEDKMFLFDWAAGGLGSMLAFRE